MQRLAKKKIVILICGIFFTIVYCEFLVYYVVISQCDWLPAKGSDVDVSSLKALIITDVHLLGHRKSNWFEKWRREWQMYQSFKAVVTLHKPEVVFVLGDLFDEGEYCTNEEFTESVERFHNTFPLPREIPMYITVGNHDIGFHNNIKPGSAERFAQQLKSPSVQLLSIKKNNFVLINSLALEGDSCRMCREARSKINNVSGILKCSANNSCNTGYVTLNYSRPILLQHFPLYRLSDAVCSEPDAAPLSEKYIPFRLKIDALSKEATDDIIAKLKPRAAFGGHTHYGCLLHHSYNYENENVDFYEHSVPSFNMRNIFEPKYMLVTITPDAYAANKCSLPREVTIIITTVVLLIATVWFACRRRPFGRGISQMRKYSIVK